MSPEKLRATLSRLFLAVACTGLFANVFLFTWRHANPLVQKDGWRYTDIFLRPVFEGSGLDWKALWGDHHPQPLNALLFIANAKVFDLRMDLEALGAVFFLPVFAALLFAAYWRSVAPYPASAAVKTMAFLPLAALVFSLSSTQTYTWSLVTIQLIPNVAVLMVLLVFDRSLRDTGTGRDAFWLAVSTAIFLVVFGDRVTLALPILVGVIAFALLLRWPVRRAALTFGAIFLALLLQRAFSSMLDFKSRYNQHALLRLYEKVTSEPVEYLLFFEKGISAGFVNLEVMAAALGLDSSLGVEHAAAGVYAVALLLFFRGRMWETSFVPLVLLAYPLVVLTATGTFRFNPARHGPDKADAPRYFVMYTFGSIGAIWIFAIAYAREAWNTGWMAGLRRGSIVSVFACVLMSQAVLSVAAWERSPAILSQANIAEKRIREYHRKPRGQIPFHVVGRNFPEPFRSGLTFLERHELNLFAKSWDPEHRGAKRVRSRWAKGLKRRRLETQREARRKTERRAKRSVRNR